jgi:ferric enterobactin receptor
MKSSTILLRLILLAPAMVTSSSIRAEETSASVDFNGVIKDQSTGEALPYATVSADSSKQTTTTNADGRFTMLGLHVTSDSVFLKVKHLGFQTKRIGLAVAGLKEIVEIELEPTPTAHDLSGRNKTTVELEEMNVTAKKILLDETIKTSDAVSQITLNPKDISKLPSIGEPDICRTLQLLPGISGTDESSAGLYVRGGTPDQNLILFDGMNVYHVDHFYGFFSAFNPQAVKDVQMYKGGFPAKYGGRTSSVMDITGKSGDVNDVNLAGGLSLLSGNALAEIPLWKLANIPLFQKGSILLVARRSYTDVIKSNLYNKIFGLYRNDNLSGAGFPGGGGQMMQMFTPGFYFYDLNGKVSLQPTDRDAVSLSAYGGKDNLDNSMTSSFAPRDSGTSATIDRKDITGWGTWGTSLKWGRQWSNRFYSNAILSYSNYFSDRINSGQSDVGGNQTSNGINEDNNVRDITARLDDELRLPYNNAVGFGGQITQLRTNYQLTQNDSVKVLNSMDTALLFSGYVQDECTFINRLTLLPGFRLNYYQGTHDYYVEPRLSARYKITNQLKLKGAWGKYYQFVNRVVREDVLQGSKDFWLLADDKISPVSSARHFIVGGSYETPMFLLDIEAYQKLMDGISEFSLRYGGIPTSGMQADSLFFEGTGIARGIEFLLQKKIGHYTGWIGYTLSDVTETFSAFNNGNPFPALQDQRHELKVVNSLSWKKWDFSATWVYATGKPYTRPIGTYDVQLLDGTTATFIHVGEKNAYRLPDYHRLDLAATYNFILGERTKTSIGVSVFNVYNRTNVWYKKFESVDGGLVETNVTFLGITPSVFVNFSLK